MDYKSKHGHKTIYLLQENRIFFLPWLRERFFTKYSKRKQKITQLKQQKVKQCLKIKSSLGDSRTMSNTFTFAL